MTDIDLPKKCKFLWRPSRYKVLYGGRGGAKSYSIAKTLLAKAVRRKLRILCARELQVSIKDSVHKLLKDQIDVMGLTGFYDVQNTQILGTNGSEFIFSGLRMNVTKIKSMEGVDIVWVEEAETVSADSWEVLIPTIRKKGSEIWASFNPNKASDPTYKKFVTEPPPGAVVVPIGWRDNPWFPGELRKEKDYLYRVDPDSASHVWGGKPRTINKAQVLFGKVSIAPFDPAEDWDGPYQGADWGYATDPTVLIRCWIHEYKIEEFDFRDLHISDEAYRVGVEVVDTPKLFDKIPNARKYVTRADSARPETISHMRNNGYPRMIACEKGPGSVEDGVMHLRSFSKIIIDPRCVHAIQESEDWSWKTDKLTGDILPVLIDKHDNCWDGARYALEPVMKMRKASYNYEAVKKRETRNISVSRGGGFRKQSGGIL